MLKPESRVYGFTEGVEGRLFLYSQLFVSAARALSCHVRPAVGGTIRAHTVTLVGTDNTRIKGEAFHINAIDMDVRGFIRANSTLRIDTVNLRVNYGSVAAVDRLVITDEAYRSSMSSILANEYGACSSEAELGDFEVFFNQPYAHTEEGVMSFYEEQVNEHNQEPTNYHMNELKFLDRT